MCSEVIHARLFIPGPNNAEAIDWRWQLVEKFASERTSSLKELLAPARSPSESELTALLTQAKDQSLSFDEFDRAILLATHWMLHAESLPIDVLLLLDPDLKIQAEFEEKELSSFLEENGAKLDAIRRDLRQQAQVLLTDQVASLRANLAFQELTAILSPDSLVPQLVAFSPIYLRCPSVQTWIASHQHRLLYGQPREQKTSRTCLNQLAKALVPDARRHRPRLYSYWKVHHDYEALTARILGFRKADKSHSLFPEFFRICCVEWKIPEHFRSLILDPEQAPAELSLEILCERGMIAEPRAFREFQPKLSKLRVKHGDNLPPLVELLLDVPTRLAHKLDPSNLISVLEQVRL